MPEHSYGWQPSKPDQRDRLFAVAEAILESLPPALDLTASPPGPPFDPVYNQGQLGSCGPNSACGNLAYDEVVEPGKPDPNPSRLFIYWCTRLLMGTVNQDSGVDNRTMLKALAQYGWCDENLWPYDVSRFKERPPQACFDQAQARAISEYRSVPQTLDQMRGCLASGKPFIFGFSVYESFESAAVAATGDVPMPRRSERVLGGHDILFVGYDDPAQRFKFRNSWGEKWGKQGGYGTMPYAFATDPRMASDFWTIVKSAGPAPLPPDPTPPVPPLPPTPPTPPTPIEATIKLSQPLAAGTYRVIA